MRATQIDPRLDEMDLLRMPAKDYMNSMQLQFFSQRLLVLKSELSQNITATTQHLRSAEVVSDPSDRATQEEEQSNELRTRDRERKLMRKIDQALARIDDGSYGYCADTGEPIGLKRLLARPTATLSLDAQERREKLERVYAA
jgi:DnaK suppressor protein